MSPPSWPWPRLARGRCSAASAHPPPRRRAWRLAPPELPRAQRPQAAAPLSGSPARKNSEDDHEKGTAMDARQIAAMAEATRLTRQGRLAEATALIQQTLAGPAVTRQARGAPSAREETRSAPERYCDPPPALPAREGKPLRRGHFRWAAPPPPCRSPGPSG